MARYLGSPDEDRIALDLGDYHPGNHGGLEIDLDIDASGTITGAEVRPGLMHRSAEKLFEARDFRQIMMLANRHDWLSGVSSELGVALAVEKATGIVPPAREGHLVAHASCEAGRIGVECALLLGARGAPGALALREAWVDWQERATGGRVHPMINRIGGLEHALPESSLIQISELVSLAQQHAVSWREFIDECKGLHGLARLDHHTARTFACSGAVGQASGVDWDIRRDDPYLAYNEIDVDWSTPVLTHGDAHARYQSLVESVRLSATVIGDCVTRLRDLADDPFSVSLPKTLRSPESVVRVDPESSGNRRVASGQRWGCLSGSLEGAHPSFAHLQAMQFALEGVPVASLSAAVASFFFVTGDADR